MQRWGSIEVESVSMLQVQLYKSNEVKLDNFTTVWFWLLQHHHLYRMIIIMNNHRLYSEGDLYDNDQDDDYYRLSATILESMTIKHKSQKIFDDCKI